MPQTRLRTSDPYQTYGGYDIPPEIESAIQKRYEEAQRRMRKLKARELAVRQRALQRHAAESGIRGGVTRGALERLQAETAAETLQRAKELEMQRLAEELGWMKGERGYAQQLGLLGAGYGYKGQLAEAERKWRTGERIGTQEFQAMQNQLNRELQATLAREGWSEKARQLAMQIESNERMQQQQLGFERERLGEELGFRREELGTRTQLSREQMQLQRDIQNLQAELQRELATQGWTAKAQMLKDQLEAEKERLGMQLGWEREKFFGPGYGGGGYQTGEFQPAMLGGGGAPQYGGLFGLEQQKLELQRQALQQAGEQFQQRLGWEQERFGQELGWQQEKFGRTWEEQQNLLRLQSDLATEMAELKRDWTLQDRALQSFYDWTNSLMTGAIDAGKADVMQFYLDQLWNMMGVEGEPPAFRRPPGQYGKPLIEAGTTEFGTRTGRSPFGGWWKGGGSYWGS